MLGSAAVTQCRGIAPAPGCGWGIKEVALGKWCWVLAWMGPGLKKPSTNRPRKESQILPNRQRGSRKQLPKCIPCFTPRCVSPRASVCVRAVALVTWPGMGSAACPSHPWAKKIPLSQHGEQDSCTDRSSQPLPRVVPGTVPAGWVTRAGLRMQLGTPPRPPCHEHRAAPGSRARRGEICTSWGHLGQRSRPLSPWKSPRDGCSAPGAAPALLGMFSWQREPSGPAAASKQTRAGLNGWRRKHPARPARVKLWAPAGQGL